MRLNNELSNEIKCSKAVILKKGLDLHRETCESWLFGYVFQFCEPSHTWLIT